jgi:acetyl/propionyl-CoA carboxylase alpha subunit
MKFSAADTAAMINAMGDEVFTPFESFYGLFQEAGKLVQTFSGEVVSSGPILTVTEAMADNIIENETALTINDINYQATQKLPDGAGFVEIELTKDF